MACTGNHRNNFYTMRLKGWRLYLRKGYARGAIQQLCDSQKLTDGIRGPFEAVESSRFCHVTKSTVSLHGFCHKLYLKEYLYRSFWDIIKHIFRPSRCERAFSGALMLEANNLLSPEIIALGKFGIFPFYKRTFVLTSEIERGRPVYSYFRDVWSIPPNQPASTRHSFVKQLAATVSKMHSSGIFHGDLRAGNILATGPGEKWQFYLLDNERTRKFRRLPVRLRVKNLVQLNMLQDGVNKTDRLRFFNTYIQQHDPFIDRKLLLKTVLEKTALRIRNRSNKSNASSI
jgi:hypothetical protein